MTAQELARRISRALLERAYQQPQPALYFARAILELTVMQDTPPEDLVAALLKFSHNHGLSGPHMN